MSKLRIVGAYAALPAEVPSQEEFYRELGQDGWDGLEIPYVFGLHSDLPWLATQLADNGLTQNVVTAIGTMMQTCAKDPVFGLASTDEAGRKRALETYTQVLAEISALNKFAGKPLVSFLELHSAPVGAADQEAFAESLRTLVPQIRAVGITPVIEHCDAANDKFPGEKRFLPLEAEMAVAQEVGVKISLNWGRSVVETHDPATPEAHVKSLVDAGLLGGLMFSGAGVGETQYGPNWGDAHLPLDVDEPLSWMSADRVRSCYRATQGEALYAGVKVQAPKAASVTRRLEMINHVRAAMES